MSGLPYPDGVAKIIELLDTVAKYGDEISKLEARMRLDQERLAQATKIKREAWEEHLKLLSEMDVLQKGNCGYEKRFSWFLAEMRRQVFANTGVKE